MPAETPAPRQRLDKWLWHARFFRTRTRAADAVEANGVRINGTRVEKPSQSIRAGDTLTFLQGRQIRIVRVAGLAERRGPPAEAAMLYDDLEPPAEEAAASARPEGTDAPLARREPGSGRPTKRARRELDRLRRTED